MTRGFHGGPVAPCVLLQCRSAAAFDELAIQVSRALTGGAPAVVVLCAHGQPLLHARAQVRALDLALRPTTTRLAARVSRSATAGLAAWAASCVAPVGVDVQSQVSTLDDAVLDLSLHPMDAHWLAGQTDREWAFTRLWAGKEAVLKAFGVGLAWSPRAVDATPGPSATPQPWRQLTVTALGSAWLIYLELESPAALRVALAVALNAGHLPPAIARPAPRPPAVAPGAC